MDNMAIQIDIDAMKADIEAFNAGRIDFRRQYIRQRKRLEPVLMEYRQRGEWDKFINMALSCYEVMPIAFTFYDEVPDDMKYRFCTKAYTHHGDSIPKVRKAVRGALKYGMPLCRRAWQSRRK